MSRPQSVRWGTLAMGLPLLAVYAVGSSWLVRTVGTSYRDTLRRHRPIAQSVPVPRASARMAIVRPPLPARPLDPPRPEPALVASTTAPTPPVPLTPFQAPTPPGPAITPAPGGSPNSGSEPTGDSIVGRDPFWGAPERKKVWDLEHLTPDDEKRLGRAMHEVIVRMNPRVNSGPWIQRVEDAAEPILELRDRKEIEYTFTVLDSDAVNAFSHTGGYVYIYRGLFNLIGEDEDYALKFALAHEIAHVDLQHTRICLSDPAVRKLGLGTLGQIYFITLPFGYLEGQDYAADRWAYDRLARLDLTRRESLAFLRKFTGYAELRQFSSTRVGPATAEGSSAIENHYQAHPPARKRLKALEALTPGALKPAK